MKSDISFQFRCCRCRRVGYFGFGMQKFVDPFLRGNSALDHAGRPANSAHGKGEHVDIYYKLGHDTYASMSSVYDIYAADHDGQQGAQPDNKRHRWKIDGLDTRQPDRIFLILF